MPKANCGHLKINVTARSAVGFLLSRETIQRMPPIRILAILHGLHRTGAPKLLLDAFDFLGNEVAVRFVSQEGGPLAPRCRALGTLDIMGSHDGQLARVRRWLSGDERPFLQQSVARWTPDLVYVNSVSALPLAARLRLANLPLLLHVHELDSYLDVYATQSSDLFHQADRYIVVSNAVREALEKRYNVPAEKIATIHAFAVEEKQAISEPSHLRGPDGTFLVGGGGSMDLRKGHAFWLQMAAELVGLLEPGRVRFAWVGTRDDSASSQFRQLAVRMGLADVVTFVPETPTPYSYFRKFDVFATTAWEDPCPIVVFENMLLGKPVACFANSGGAAEQVGDTGIVVEGFSPQKMAMGIADLLNDPDRRGRMGAAARRRVQENFTVNVQAPKILQQIREVVSDNAERGSARR